MCQWFLWDEDAHCNTLQKSIKLYLYALFLQFKAEGLNRSHQKCWIPHGEVNQEVAISLLEKGWTSLAMATAEGAQLSGNVCGRQRRCLPSQRLSFTDQIVTACLLQGKGRKKPQEGLIYQIQHTHAT